jgi:hypothetical protein
VGHGKQRQPNSPWRLGCAGQSRQWEVGEALRMNIKAKSYPRKESTTLEVDLARASGDRGREA